MGKTSSRASRSNRPSRQRVRARVSRGDLTITIATGPTIGPNGISLENDIRLVRAALLYADRVELLSPAALMVNAAAALGAAGPEALMDVVAGLGDDFLATSGRDPVDVRSAIRVAQMSRRQRRQVFGSAASTVRRQVQDTLAQVEPSLTAAVQGIYGASGADELSQPIEQGLLTFATPGSADPLDMDYYVDALKRLVEGGTHVLFDEQLSSLVGAMINESLVIPHRLTLDRGARILTGTGMIERLPAFPDSTMDHILQARTELSEPLVQYRVATVAIASKLSAGPFASDVQTEIDDLWRDEVSPAIVKLKQDFSKTRLLRDAALGVFTDLASLTAGGLTGFLAMGVADLGAVPSAIVTAISTAGASAARTRSKSMDTSRENQLFYLYELDQHRLLNSRRSASR